MPKTAFRTLGLDPGTNCLGFAFLREADLGDWGVKVVKGKWSASKKRKVLSLVDGFLQRFEPDVLALKHLHPSRSSAPLNALVREIKAQARARQIGVREYSIDAMEQFFCAGTRTNKKELAQAVARDYPVLYRELEKEKVNRHPYHIAAFEAAALGALCFYQVEVNHKKRKGAFC